MLIKTKMLKNIGISCFYISDDVFILLINAKMPTIVGILTFMSRINFMLSSVEYEKSFITSGPGVRSAMHAASQLPGRGPNDVNDAHTPAC